MNLGSSVLLRHVPGCCCQERRYKNSILDAKGMRDLEEEDRHTFVSQRLREQYLETMVDARCLVERGSVDVDTQQLIDEALEGAGVDGLGEALADGIRRAARPRFKADDEAPTCPEPPIVPEYARPFPGFPNPSGNWWERRRS